MAPTRAQEVLGWTNTLRGLVTTSIATKLWRCSGVDYVNASDYGYRSNDGEFHNYMFGVFSIVFDYANGTDSQGTVANYRSTSSYGDYRPIAKADHARVESDYARVWASYTESSTADYSESRTSNPTPTPYIV